MLHRPVQQGQRICLVIVDGLMATVRFTEQPDGTMKYEIKAQDKFQMFKP